MTDTIGQDQSLTGDAALGDKLGTPEGDLITRMDRFADESREQRTLLTNHWVKALRYWRGGKGHWRDRKRRKYQGEQWTEAVHNRVLPIIEQQIAMMSDNNPKGLFIPTDMTDPKFAKDLQLLTDSRTRRIRIRSKIIRALYNAKLFGSMAMYVYWDDSTIGMADTNSRLLSPTELIVDPKLKDCNVDDGEYVGFEYQVSLEYLKWRWSEKADELEAASRSNNEGQFQTVQDVTSLDEELGNEPNTNIAAVNEDTEVPTAQFMALWYRDYTARKVEIPTPLEILEARGEVALNAIGRYVYVDNGELYTEENAPLMDTTEQVYPFGRCTMKSGNVILEDFAWGEDAETGEVRPALWPIALGINAVIPGRWYGRDETEALQYDQNIVNDMVSQITDHCDVAVHPPLVYDSTLINDPRLIKCTPNTKIPCKGNVNAALIWRQVPDIGGDPYKLLDLTLSNMETSSGMPAQSISRQSKGQQTATEIMTLDRAGRGRVGLATALLDEFIARLYLLLGQNIQQNYSEKQRCRVLGTDQSSNEITITREHKSALYDVEVEAGSTLPYDKESRRQQAVELNNILSSPGPYLPEVLDAYEVKNKEEVLQRVQQWQMFMQYAPILGDPRVQQLLNNVMMEMQGEQQNENMGARQ